MKKYKISIVGSTGVVGRELLKLLETTKIPINQLKCFASSKSKGKKLPFRNSAIEVECVDDKSFDGMDFILFCTEGEFSSKFVPMAVKAGAIAIDSSSYYRMDPSVPLIIPEINGNIIKEKKYNIIASPNCTTTIMLMALHHLHNEFIIDSIIASTYQAASGGGKALLDLLVDETKKCINEETFIPSYAFNVYLHDSQMHENNYCSEELKMLYESRKILQDENIKISATCVRVPVMRAHSISLNITFKKDPAIDKIKKLLKKSSGVIYDDGKMPTPQMASGKNNIFVGRVRKPLFQPCGLEMWVVGDQLLKGAALNVLQIVELLCPC